MRINNFKLIPIFQLNEIIDAVSGSDIKTLNPLFIRIDLDAVSALNCNGICSQSYEK